MPSPVSSWLPWLIVAAIPVAAVILRLFAGDDPRNDPPDSGEDPRRAGVPA